MAGGKLSDKEAAFLAAIKKEQAKAGGTSPPPAPGAVAAPSPGKPPSTVPGVRPAAPSIARPSTPLQPKVSPPVTTEPPAITLPEAPKLDMATRMAMLIEGEKEAQEERKRRIKKTYTIILCAILVPAFLYVALMLFRILLR